MSENYLFKYVTIESERLSQPVNIQNVVTDLEIFESIRKPYLTGKCAFVDGQDLLSKLDLIGGERLTFSLVSKKPTSLAIEKTFYIVSHTVQKAGDNQQVVLLNLIEEHAFVSNLKNVNRFYSGKISEIIEKVVDQFLSKKLNHEDNDVKTTKLIVPNLDPCETTQWLTSKAVTQEGYPFYTFSVLANNDIYMRDLVTMLQAPSINEGYSYSALSYQTKAKDPDQARRSIIDHRFSHGKTLFEMIQTSKIGSKYEYIDTHGKKHKFMWNIKEDLYDDLVQNVYQAPQQNPPYSTEYKIDTESLHDFQTKSITRVGGNNPYRETDNELEYTVGICEERSLAEYKRTLIAPVINTILGHAPLTMVVDGVDFIDGDKHSGVGNNIDVLIPNSDPDKPEYDKKKSGKYLISEARYMFKREKAEVSLLCVKLGNERR